MVPGQPGRERSAGLRAIRDELMRSASRRFLTMLMVLLFVQLAVPRNVTAQTELSAADRDLLIRARQAGLSPRRARQGRRHDADGRPRAARRAGARPGPAARRDPARPAALARGDARRADGSRLRAGLRQPPARGAARLLLDDSWSGHGEVPVLGPGDLTYREVAEIMSDVLGRPVRFEQLSAEALKASLRQRGWSEAMAQAMVDMAVAKNAGLDNAEPRTPEATTPTTLRQWCEEVPRPAVASAG
ncbi:NmrA family protein [Amycolatopsis methanolica 239]|uniref:NmrA family protein n=1 Tax=Amycolatopsis methanolica 239 TaxID=1068978 RepID=A0A076N4D0_AMYME|nr:NmrA family protein [Amycolatopsis methanolica 239]